MHQIGLTSTQIEAVLNILSQYSKVDKAFLFGSRAMGNFKPYSDIDLTLVGKELELSDLTAINSKLDELLIPVPFDLSIYHQISNKDLIEHIKRHSIIFYSRT